MPLTADVRKFTLQGAYDHAAVCVLCSSNSKVVQRIAPSFEASRLFEVGFLPPPVT